MFSGGPIACKSKLQSCVATSSVQSEYQALYDCGRQIVWIRRLLKEIGHEQLLPTIIHEDNSGCISLTKNNRTDPLSKHIDVKYHYTRELVANKTIEISKIETLKQIADSFTKPINAPKFLWCRDQIGVHNLLHNISNLRGRVETQDTALSLLADKPLSDSVTHPAETS